LAALARCLVATTGEAFDRGALRPATDDPLLAENRWRAVRDGLDAVLVDLADDDERPARVAILDLIDRCAAVARRLGCEEELAAAEQLLMVPTGADEQCAVAAETGRLDAVVEWLVGVTALDP
jgi:carboxylate-amine ligase